MIRVSVHLISAISRSRDTELARMDISNDGTGTAKKRNYVAMTYRGRSSKALDAGVPNRRCEVEGWAAEDLHIWNLIQWCLTRMGYDDLRPGTRARGPGTVAEPELAGWRYPLNGRWAFVTEWPDRPDAEPVYVFRDAPVYQ